MSLSRQELFAQGRLVNRRASLRVLSTLVPAASLALGAAEQGELQASAEDRVAIGYLPGASIYPQDPPFDPSSAYPEYPYPVSAEASQRNDAYAVTREALRVWQQMGSAAESGTPWARS